MYHNCFFVRNNVLIIVVRTKTVLVKWGAFRGVTIETGFEFKLFMNGFVKRKRSNGEISIRFRSKSKLGKSTGSRKRLKKVTDQSEMSKISKSKSLFQSATRKCCHRRAFIFS